LSLRLSRIMANLNILFVGSIAAVISASCLACADDHFLGRQVECTFGMTSSGPCIAIAYAHKITSSGIMSGMELKIQSRQQKLGCRISSPWY
jgi:hypothetical protein